MSGAWSDFVQAYVLHHMRNPSMANEPMSIVHEMMDALGSAQAKCVGVLRAKTPGDLAQASGEMMRAVHRVLETVDRGRVLINAMGFAITEHAGLPLRPLFAQSEHAGFTAADDPVLALLERDLLWKMLARGCADPEGQQYGAGWIVALERRVQAGRVARLKLQDVIGWMEEAEAGIPSKGRRHDPDQAQQQP